MPRQSEHHCTMEDRTTANPVVFGSPQPTQGHRTWARNGPRMHGISISAIPWQPTGTVQEIPLGY